MLTISIEEAVNGFIVTIWNPDEYKPYKETTETYIQALAIVGKLIEKNTKQELSRIERAWV